MERHVSQPYFFTFLFAGIASPSASASASALQHELEVFSCSFSSHIQAFAWRGFFFYQFASAPVREREDIKMSRIFRMTLNWMTNSKKNTRRKQLFPCFVVFVSQIVGCYRKYWMNGDTAGVYMGYDHLVCQRDC